MQSEFLKRLWPELRAKLVSFGLAEPLLWLGLLGLEQTRRRLAMRYLLAGSEGLEIGALHCPLPLPDGAHAHYIDINMPSTLKELRADAGNEIVIPDIITDGFCLSCIAPASQEFVIANHVLEHATDALGTLENWMNVMRPGGVLFISVPLGYMCFDRGRKVTTTDHFLDDYHMVKAGKFKAMQERNLTHIEEHLAISAPVLAVMEGVTWVAPVGKERENMIERYLGVDCNHIHHHVFTKGSFTALLSLLPELHGGSVCIEHVASSRVEIVGIVRKLY